MKLFKIPLKESQNQIAVAPDMAQIFETVLHEQGILKTSHVDSVNEIITYRYTWWNFIPKCLWEQLTRPANTYFLLVGALQCIKPVSTSEGVPAIAMPLSIVIMVAMAKNGYEDWKRHKNDEEENNRRYVTIKVDEPSTELVKGNKPAHLVKTPSKDIKVGDIILVPEGEIFPADMLLIGVSPKSAGDCPPSFCHVETSNIDGETTLKVRYVPEVLNAIDQALFDFVDTHLAPDPHRRSSRNIEIDRKNNCYPTEWKNFSTKVEISQPDCDLDSWKNSQIIVENKETKAKATVQLSLDNFLTRGAMLQNTNHVFGLVVYTGRNCKVYKNSANTANTGKSSKFESALGYTVAAMAFAMLSMCTIMAISTFIWNDNNVQGAWYLRINSDNFDPGLEAFTRFFTWIIIFSQCIPVSLIVSLEMMRFAQGKKMENDPKMKETFIVAGNTRVKGCNVQDSALNEDLGRVEFVFSDKTGTLTENQLDFRQLLVSGNEMKGGGYTQIAWMNMKRRGFLEKLQENGESEEIIRLISNFKISPQEAKEYLEKSGNDFVATAKAITEDKTIDVPHCSFTQSARNEVRECLAESFKNQSLDKILAFDQGYTPDSPKNDPNLQNELYFRSLLFNNDVFPVIDRESHDGIMYNADNPDDICFGWFCHYIGIRLIPYRKPYKEILIEMPGLDPMEETWKELCILKFSSAKKRMSVVMQRTEINNRQCEDDRVFVFLKGADSMVKTLASEKSLEFYEKTMSAQVDKFCEEGLRTLLVAYACYSLEWWNKNWAHRFAEKLSDEDREALEIEFDKCVEYHICGVTAVEDKLQDQVPETVDNLLNAGIRTWVLTGDKKETARNIGCACNLLTPEMEESGCLHEFLEHNYLEQLESIDITVMQKSEQIHGLVITGAAIESIFTNEKAITDMFINFALSCHSVVACRLQPSSKARIVKSIQDATGCVTLAIGDGANDEAMIKTANIGIGIAGLEGTAAARASDYAISKFRMLNSLLFVHGRNSYRGTSFMVYYSIYKNAIHTFSFFWFAFYSGFSGNVLYLETVWQMWNAAFTALPVFTFVLCDRDISETILLAFPTIYSLTNGNSDKPALGINTKKSSWLSMDNLNSGALYNKRVFVIWLIEAFVQSAFAINVFFTIFIDASSFEYNGKSWGLMEVSILLYTGFVLLANFMLCLSFTHYTFYHNLILIGTILSYFVFMIVINNPPIMESAASLAGYDYRGIVLYIFSKEIFWLMLLLMVCVTMLFSTFILLVKSLFFSSKLHQYQRHTKKNRPFCSCRLKPNKTKSD